VDDIVATLAANVNEADVVAVYSNGGFGGLHKKLLKALEERFAEATKGEKK
jgi:UDP-N-acetylmuramate: L-alanyl-gamma-D-glutamyl-meso-diaminopimelate ligase